MATGLATYNTKRDFKKTAEPPGRVARPSKGLPSYVIQKHDASRLHYDFRLEIDGVLVSWAIPKGPSMDPGERRLAVRTEDHPMDYGGFEGTIPKGQYGGGTVMLWDHGRFEPIGDAKAGLKKGDLKFKLNGVRLQGEFVLARMKPRPGEKGENWLLIKKRDAAAKPGSKDAVVQENMTSVKTSRAMDEIAGGADKGGKSVWQSNRAAVPDKPVEKKTKSKAMVIDPTKLPGARAARMPPKITPQLATLVEEPPEDKGWLSEIKFDGYRMLARIDNGEVQIFSRNGLPWEGKLPTIARALATLGVEQAWLDGEIVVLDEEGKSNFSRLKDALGESDQRSIFFFVFDVLYLNGTDVRGCRQDDRKKVLKSIIGTHPPAFIKYSDDMPGLPEPIQKRACEMHLEGIIIKQAAAPYSEGRTRHWLKLKCIQREEFVVVGYTDPQGSRTGFGALLLGYYDAKGELHFAGGLGSGFNTKTLQSLHKHLERHSRRIPPAIWIHGEKPPKGTHWVKPDTVIEIQFTEWTKAGTIRHGVFLGTRDDKSGADVVREPPSPAVSRFSGPGAVVSVAPAVKTKARPKTAKSKVAAPAIIETKRTDDGEAVKLTHPDKVLWPADGFTKADLAAYWERAAPYALPYIAGRPLALVRCPEGIEGEKFFQKKLTPGFPKPVLDVKAGGERLIAISDADGLRALSQMSSIEIHPWGCTVEDIERPDLIVMDLDPDPAVDFDHVAEAAREIRDALAKAGLTSFCKTTGGKGLHVVVPFAPGPSWDEVKAFARAVAVHFTSREPDRFIDTMSKKARKGRIFIDYLRNGRGATAIAPFAPRARAGAPIAMPIKWAQVKPGLDPADYTIAASEKQIKAGAAAWDGFFKVKQTLSAKVRSHFNK